MILIFFSLGSILVGLYEAFYKFNNNIVGLHEELLAIGLYEK